MLDRWQADYLEGALGENPDGSWAAMQCGLIVPRQNGKGAILTARELAGLYLFDEQLIIHSAHEFKTAVEAFRRILELIEATSDLARKVRRVLQNNIEHSIELTTGQRLRFMARSKGAGRGFSGDTIILDEAYKLASEVVSAIVPTMAAMPNPQLWLTSSAPLDDPASDTLRNFMRKAREGLDGTYYEEYAVATPEELIADPMAFRAWIEAALDDANLWRDANPGLGIRITEHFIRTVERPVMTDENFARERLGIYDDRHGLASDFPIEHWVDCLDEQSKCSPRRAFTFDVRPDGSRSSISVSDGVHIETIENRPGTSWVVDRLIELRDRWSPVATGCDPKSSGRLLAEATQKGLEVHLFSVADLCSAAAGLVDAVKDHRVRHIGQPELDAAVRAAKQRIVGDAWLWTRRGSEEDISPLVSVSGARWLAIATLEEQEQAPAEFYTI